jgi:hypothetical protein
MKDVVIDIKEHVTAGNCVFQQYRAGNLWYRTAKGFEFPVPVSDIGSATYEAEVKGMTLMRYVRKHAETLAEARKARAA